MALPQRDHENTEERSEQDLAIKTKSDFDIKKPLTAYINIWKSVIFDPKKFYFEMPVDAGYINPYVFMLINGAISGLLIGLIMRNPAGVIIGPIVVSIASLIIASLYHVFALVFTNHAPGGFQGTWRVVAYSSAILLVSWLPYIGALIGLYAVYIQIMGIEEVHNTSAGTSIAIVLSPLILAILLMVVSMLTIGFSILA